MQLVAKATGPEGFIVVVECWHLNVGVAFLFVLCFVVSWYPQQDRDRGHVKLSNKARLGL